MSALAGNRLRAGLLAALLGSATIADTQDRRRAGSRAERDSAVELPATTDTIVEDRNESPPAPLPRASGVPRRRAGSTDEEPPVRPVSKEAAQTPSSSESGVQAVADRPKTTERRRAGRQSVYTQPGAGGERATPGALPRDRKPSEVNSRSGLRPVPKPGREAPFNKELIVDRSRLTRDLGITDFPWYDPYNQNSLKGDRPVFVQDWYFNARLQSETFVEPRRLPTPVAPQGESDPGSFDLIGDPNQKSFIHNLVVALVLYKGDTSFKPPDWEFRFTPVFNVNKVEINQYRGLLIDPSDGFTRSDKHVGIQELFVDKHLRDLTSRFDFDSVRLGIQPFNADFRGFLFRDQQLGIRYFGNRDNNRFLFNIAAFRRLEKDTNSELNDIGQPLRKDDIFIINAYWQDNIALGFTTQAVLLYNRNTEGDDESYFNQNGFIERPSSFGLEKGRSYDVLYAGLAGEGHIGRINLSLTGYAVAGEADRGVFVDRPTDIAAYFFASELSMDFDWRRFKFSALYASGDDDPYDDLEGGFDAVFENPLFAGAETSFWVRQNVPLIGGGGVTLSGRQGLLNNLRSSKIQGQSNFTNPGTVLLGVGADLDMSPQLRVSANINQILFADTAVIEAARHQANVGSDLGTDISVATVWRPLFSQNIILRASAATLIPGAGYKALFGDEMPYSMLLNLTLTY